MKINRHFVIASLATTALTLAGGASAQLMSPNGRGTGMDENRYSVLPYTRNGYVGVNLGASDYDTDCGLLGVCENSDIAGKVYTGGMFNRNFGLEVAYLHTGRAERAGGTTHGYGLNVSAVGRLPVNRVLALFAKGGVTYGRTKTTSTPGSGVASGSENDFGPSLGGGLEVAMTPRLAAVLEYERHRFQFAGGDRDWVAQTTVGLKYQF